MEPIRWKEDSYNGYNTDGSRGWKYGNYTLRHYDSPGWRMPIHRNWKLFRGFNCSERLGIIPFETSDAEAFAWAERLIKEDITKTDPDEMDVSISLTPENTLKIIYDKWLDDHGDEYKLLILPEDLPFESSVAGHAEKFTDGVTAVLLTMDDACTKSENRGEPVFGLAVKDGIIIAAYFPAGQCPWLVHQSRSWPEGYEQYGAFICQHPETGCIGMAIRKGIVNTFIVSDHPAPENYNWYTSATDFSRVAPWIKTKDFTK
jgi:hypothetical protein